MVIKKSPTSLGEIFWEVFQSEHKELCFRDGQGYTLTLVTGLGVCRGALGGAGFAGINRVMENS